MKVRPLSTLIFKLRVLNLICSQTTNFLITLPFFLIPALIMRGIDTFSILFVLLGHYLCYKFKFQKIYQELLPQKRKIINAIDILKKRRIERY